jgi:hypothetical protein
MQFGGRLLSEPNVFEDLCDAVSMLWRWPEVIILRACAAEYRGSVSSE